MCHGTNVENHCCRGSIQHFNTPPPPPRPPPHCINSFLLLSMFSILRKTNFALSIPRVLGPIWKSYFYPLTQDQGNIFFVSLVFLPYLEILWVWSTISWLGKWMTFSSSLIFGPIRKDKEFDPLTHDYGKCISFSGSLVFGPLQTGQESTPFSYFDHFEKNCLHLQCSLE